MRQMTAGRPVSQDCVRAIRGNVGKGLRPEEASCRHFYKGAARTV